MKNHTQILYEMLLKVIPSEENVKTIVVLLLLPLLTAMPGLAFAGLDFVRSEPDPGGLIRTPSSVPLYVTATFLGRPTNAHVTGTLRIERPFPIEPITLSIDATLPCEKSDHGASVCGDWTIGVELFPVDAMYSINATVTTETSGSALIFGITYLDSADDLEYAIAYPGGQ